MFRRFFGPTHEPAADRAEQALRDGAHGETATVRRIVARLEAMPPDHARLAAAAAYTLARAANADLHISDDETRVMEDILQEHGLLDEAESVVVVEMAKLQAKAVGGSEDYVVTREFKGLATEEQRIDVLRACFAVTASGGTITAEEAAVLNQIGRELDLEPATVNRVRSEFHERLSAVQEIRRITRGDVADG